MKIFCQECGQPNNYEVAKPKFCSNCGNSFGVAIAKKPTPVYRDQEEEEDGEFASGFRIPQITSDDIDLGPKSVPTLGALYGTAQGSSNQEIRPKGNGKKDLNKLREVIKTKRTQDI